MNDSAEYLWSCLFSGYGKDLIDVVDDETSGDLNKLLVQLIKVMWKKSEMSLF